MEDPLATPTQSFLSHALDFAGINGGNPNGRLWFCGIEFGKEDHQVELDDPSIRMPPGATFPCWSEEYAKQVGGWEIVCSWPYIQKMARIAMAFGGRPAATLEDVRVYTRTRLLHSDGDTLHLNLYPLPLNNAADSEFGDEHRRRTGFPNKTWYRAWCMEYRFPRLRQLVERHSPLALVCTGTSFAADFRLAFLGEEGTHSSPVDVVDLGREHPTGRAGSRKVEFYRMNAGPTLLAITPFLGQGGIMANDELETLGRILAERTSR